MTSGGCWLFAVVDVALMQLANLVIEQVNIPWPWLTSADSASSIITTVKVNNNNNNEAIDLSPVVLAPSEVKTKVMPKGRPIPLLPPSRPHNAKRVLRGFGVNHLNLIQIRGKTAHPLQPKLIHRRY